MRRFAILALVPVLLVGTSESIAARGVHDGLDRCGAGQPAPTAPPTALPTTADASCRAIPTEVMPAAAALPRPSPGYHHLGATTTGRYAGSLGRIGVSDPGVRRGTYDFVATRFMAKVDSGGATHWLEAGWAEAGWADDKQRVYTFDTARDSWTFYDQFPLRPGDRIWLHLEAGDGDGGHDTRAWLWWGDRWHLLASMRLPFGTGAQIEQYVEVYIDPAHGGTVSVPLISVDNVRVKAGSDMRFWRAADVPTAAGGGTDNYCLDWQVRYDTWSAGDCNP